MNSLKLIWIGFVIIVNISCSEKPKDFYEGYIYNENKQPLQGVQIRENYPTEGKQGVTNEKGYFKFKRDYKKYICNLIILKEGYKTDTLELSRGGGGAGKAPTLFFLRKQSDTLIMNAIKSHN
jgi:hypothetical protein